MGRIFGKIVRETWIKTSNKIMAQVEKLEIEKSSNSRLRNAIQLLIPKETECKLCTYLHMYYSTLLLLLLLLFIVSP